jgi:hypothetical protein
MTSEDCGVVTCANCGTPLAGEFCHACGQKRFVESDRRFGHLLHQFLASATDLDGRFWRTLRALLFQPGLLSHEYFEGRRARWLSPVSLFLAVSVVYFVAPLRGGDLTLQFNQQVAPEVRAQALGPDEELSGHDREAGGQWYSAFTRRWIEQRVARRDAAARAASGGAAGYAMRDYRLAYDARADDVSKALVVLHVPFAALALMGVFWRRHRYYAEHFVVALHFLAFWMIALQVVLQLIHLAGLLPAAWQPPAAAYDWLMRIVLSGYAILALRRAYDVRWPMAVVAAFVFTASLVFVNIYFYRAVQFAVTFLLT